MKYIESDSEPAPESESVSIASDRLSSLTPAQGWLVLLVDDLHGWRDWQRLESRLRGRSDADDADEIKKEIAELLTRVELEVRPVIMWAVRSHPDRDDEIVALVPTETGLVPADTADSGRHVLKLMTEYFLDEDERRAAMRDGFIRRKLEWYSDKRRD